MPDQNDPIHFEASLNALERMVEKMSTGQLSLEEALKNFEEGIALARYCQNALKEAEQKVQILIEQNGETRFDNFNEED